MYTEEQAERLIDEYRVYFKDYIDGLSPQAWHEDLFTNFLIVTALRMRKTSEPDTIENWLRRQTISYEDTIAIIEREIVFRRLSDD